ncbi:serine carboxypeptidase-domain-containing protein [Chytriomyces sp. MP71]|nr:serine carboxypeptidase-domain-containing protein [Chytriomyces sp. MP71]
MTTPANFLVTGLPYESSAVTSSLNGQSQGAGTNYFFWYFPTTNAAATNNLIIWLNGGPGCSSMEGLWTENGPVLFGNSGTDLQPNPYSWHLQGSILYIDQPAGTGFSPINSGSYDDITLASYFNTFLNNWYNVFPDAKGKNLYITGESYAGTYIPYIASNLIKAKTLKDGTPINLKGLGIGNPYFSPAAQSPPKSSIADYDFFNEAGFFNRPDIDTSSIKTQAGNVAQQGGDVPGLLSKWYTQNYDTFGSGNTCFDPYWITKEYPCDNSYNDAGYIKEGYMADYLNLAAVQSAIHVANEQINWAECNNVKLSDSKNAASATLFDSIISAGVNVVIYDGDKDSVCHYVGVERVLGNTTWAGGKGFSKASQNWVVNGQNSGLIWNDRGLSYVRIFGPGHMVPADSPVLGSAVLTEVLAGSSSPLLSITVTTGATAISVATTTSLKPTSTVVKTTSKATTVISSSKTTPPSTTTVAPSCAHMPVPPPFARRTATAATMRGTVNVLEKLLSIALMSSADFIAFV